MTLFGTAMEIAALETLLAKEPTTPATLSKVASLVIPAAPALGSV